MIDALNVDDLWGFLGKKDASPIGPKRRIQTAKLAVLDAFFKKKYPTLAASFRVETPLLELISIFRSFFAKNPEQKFSTQSLHDIFRLFEGVLIPKPWVSAAHFRQYLKGGAGYDFVIPIFIVNHKSGANHCVVHKVEFPLESSFLDVGTIENRTIEKLLPKIDKHKPSETIIYSGVGFLCPSEYGRPKSEITCVLRDRTTYSPYLTSLSFDRMDSGNIHDPVHKTHGATEKSGGYNVRYFSFCHDARNYATMKDEFGYSSEFIDNIFDLKEKLGLEV